MENETEVAALRAAVVEALRLLERAIIVLRKGLSDAQLDSSRRTKAREMLDQAGYPPNAVD